MAGSQTAKKDKIFRNRQVLLLGEVAPAKL